MPFRFRVAIASAAALLAGACYAFTDDFSIRLQVRCGSREQTATGPPAARPLFSIKSGEPLHVEWRVTNGDKPGTIHDVTLHCFLTREQAPGQAAPTKPGPDAIYESALGMDFQPKAHSSADFVVQSPGPGIYLLQIETMGAAKEHGHEHYAAMDVKIE